jgi:hypothetical protein
MSRLTSILLAVSFALLLSASLACHQKYTVSPATPFTPTPTATPFCCTTTMLLGSTVGFGAAGTSDLAQGADLSLLGQNNPGGAYVIRTQAEWESIFASAASIPTAPVDLNTTMLILIQNPCSCPSTSVALTSVCAETDQVRVDITHTTRWYNCNVYCPGYTICAVAVPNNNLPIDWVITEVVLGLFDDPPVVVPTPG